MQQLSRQSVENLLDLVEIKLSCIQVLDREDQREQENLETCHDELLEIREELGTTRRRGRPRAANDSRPRLVMAH
jgi:hypothetical protein